MAHTLFGKQRSFLTDDPPLVPGFAFWGDCGKLDSWHNMPSDPPSLPRHQHSADDRNIALVLMAVVRSLGNAVSLQAHSTALSHSDGCCTVNECQLSFSRLLSTQTNTELSKHRSDEAIFGELCKELLKYLAFGGSILSINASATS